MHYPLFILFGAAALTLSAALAACGGGGGSARGGSAAGTISEICARDGLWGWGIRLQ